MLNTSAASTIRTTSREYKIQPINPEDASRGWEAVYRPLNKKTGTPWQASRAVPGHNGYLTNTSHSAQSGLYPAFETWASLGITSARRVYLSSADALAAIRAFDKEVA